MIYCIIRTVTGTLAGVYNDEKPSQIFIDLRLIRNDSIYQLEVKLINNYNNK